MTPLRGARSVVYSSATRACCSSASAVPDARRGGVGLGAADVELLLRHDPVRASSDSARCALPLRQGGLGLRQAQVRLRAIDRGAVVARVELDQRVAGLHARSPSSTR